MLVRFFAWGLKFSLKAPITKIVQKEERR